MPRKVKRKLEEEDPKDLGLECKHCHCVMDKAQKQTKQTSNKVFCSMCKKKEAFKKHTEYYKCTNDKCPNHKQDPFVLCMKHALKFLDEKSKLLQSLYNTDKKENKNNDDDTEMDFVVSEKSNKKKKVTWQDKQTSTNNDKNKNKSEDDDTETSTGTFVWQAAKVGQCVTKCGEGCDKLFVEFANTRIFLPMATSTVFALRQQLDLLNKLPVEFNLYKNEKKENVFEIHVYTVENNCFLKLKQAASQASIKVTALFATKTPENEQVKDLLTEAAASTFGKQYLDNRYRQPDYDLESIEDASNRCVNDMCNVIMVGFDKELVKALKSKYFTKKKSNLNKRIKDTCESAINFGESEMEKYASAEKELSVSVI